DQPAREAGQDRCEGGQPWALRNIPDGRGRGAARDVRRHPGADRPAAGAARAGMTGLRSDAATERWLRCASTRANHRVLPLRCGQQLASTPCRTPNTGFTVAKTSEGSILPRKVSESGECRIKSLAGIIKRAAPGVRTFSVRGLAVQEPSVLRPPLSLVSGRGFVGDGPHWRQLAQISATGGAAPAPRAVTHS